MAGQSKVQFVRGGTTISIEGPDGGCDISPQPNWVTDQTADLTRISYRTTNTLKTTVKMQLNNLTLASWKLLRDFFYNTALGPTNSFSYTHTDGQVYSGCLFAMQNLDAKRANQNEYAVALTLEVPGNFDP